MTTRSLGRSGLTVSSLGLGCMGMSWAYGTPNDSESLRVMHRYLEAGGNFLDTAEIYGPYTNEELLAKFLREVPRSKVVLATKFGFRIVNGDVNGVDSSPEVIRRSCEGSLKRLGVDHIDLYYQHRVDPAVPIETVMDVLANLVAEGKIRHIGLCEASPATLRRASAVHPVTALQSEYSLWAREPEINGTLAACRELGIGFVPYSPLGRGFLTGSMQKREDLAADDRRHQMPRFQEGNFEQNLKLVDSIRSTANEKGCTPAQLALAWVLAQGNDIVPIPGTKRLAYLEENLGEINVVLSEEELTRLSSAIPAKAASGERYSAGMMKLIDH